MIDEFINSSTNNIFFLPYRNKNILFQQCVDYIFTKECYKSSFLNIDKWHLINGRNKLKKSVSLQVLHKAFKKSTNCKLKVCHPLMQKIRG